MVVGPILGLIEAGASLEADILPVIRSVAASGRRGRTWGYYLPAIEEAIGKRQVVAVNAKPSGPSEPTVDFGTGWVWPESTVRMLLARWRANPGIWEDWKFGPPPGKPGCRIPNHLLIEEVA